MTTIPKSIDIGTLKYGSKYLEMPFQRNSAEQNEVFSFLIGKEAFFKFNLIEGYHYKFSSYSFISSHRKNIVAELYQYDEDLIEIKKDLAAGSNDEIMLQVDCEESGEYFLYIYYIGSSRLSIQIKCTPGWKQKSFLSQENDSKNSVVDYLLRKELEQNNSSENNKRKHTNGEKTGDGLEFERRSEPRNDSFNTNSLNGLEIYSIHVGFEIEIFSYLKSEPVGNFQNFLKGNDNSELSAIENPENNNEQLVIIKQNQLTIPIAKTGPGIMICGFSYGTTNSILVFLKNKFDVYKIYKISGFAKPLEHIIQGMNYSNVETNVKREEPNHKPINSGDERNIIIEGRRRTGDRRSGIDRRQTPSAGRRRMEDRRHRQLKDRRQK